MPIVRRSRRLSNQTLPDPIIALDQCVPGGFDYLDIPSPATEPLPVHPVTAPVTHDQLPPSQTIEYLSAFADQREVSPPDLHSQCRRRKGKNGNAPRPPNAFMLFRSDFWKFNKEKIPERDHRQISRLAAHCWNALEEPRRVPYQERARQLKDEHAQLYPQHKYNLPTRERVTRRVKKETDNDEMCGVIAVQAQVVRASTSSNTSTSDYSEGSLLDQVVEQNVSLKRPRPASPVLVVGRVFKGKPQHSQPPVKKRKRNLRKPSIATITVPAARSPANPSRSSTPPFVPTDKTSTLRLPPSRNSPAVEVEPVHDQVLEFAACIAAFIREPTASPPPMMAPPRVQTSEFEVPRLSALQSSPEFQNSGPPTLYLPSPADPVVDEGLRFSEDYGLARPTEGLDFSSFERTGDSPAMSMSYVDEHQDEFTAELQYF